MDHAVDALERPGDGFTIANIRTNKFHLGIEITRSFRAGMDLREEAIEDADPITAPDQLGCDLPPDESRSTRDKNMFRHSSHSLDILRNHTESRFEKLHRNDHALLLETEHLLLHLVPNGAGA